MRIKVPYTNRKCGSVAESVKSSCVFFWGEGSLLSDGEHLNNCHQPTVYRYYYRPTTSNIATVKQHKIKNSVANSLAVISTSFPRDLLTTDPQCMPFRPKKGGGVAFLQMASALAIFGAMKSDRPNQVRLDACYLLGSSRYKPPARSSVKR